MTDAARQYPLPQPTSPAEDPRFTVGLVLEVAEVLSRHGYPRPETSPADFTELQQALFRFLYAPTPDRAVDNDRQPREAHQPDVLPRLPLAPDTSAFLDRLVVEVQRSTAEQATALQQLRAAAVGPATILRALYRMTADRELARASRALGFTLARLTPSSLAQLAPADYLGVVPPASPEEAEVAEILRPLGCATRLHAQLMLLAAAHEKDPAAAARDLAVRTGVIVRDNLAAGAAASSSGRPLGPGDDPENARRH